MTKELSALANAREHRCAPRQHDVRIQVLADIHVALHDALERRVMDAARLLAHEAGLEEHLGATEALAAYGDDVAIWQLVRLLFVRALCGRFHLSVEIKGNVRQ